MCHQGADSMRSLTSRFWTQRSQMRVLQPLLRVPRCRHFKFFFNLNHIMCLAPAADH